MSDIAINWDRIEGFIGFGRRDAPVVFIGMEEGLTKQDALLQDLRHRSQFKPIMDLKEAHCGIAGASKYFCDKPKCQRTWRPMCDLMLRRDGVSAPTLQDRNLYQADRLGRSEGDTLLAELLPYPNKRGSDWPSLYKRRYPTRDEYRNDQLPKRKKLLSRVLKQSGRELIVCYCKKDWQEYEQLFSIKRWHERPPFRLAKVRGTRIVLAPHFAARQFNTDEQLACFANVALG